MKRVFQFIFIGIIVSLALWVVKDIEFIEVYYIIKASNVYYFILAFFLYFLAFLLVNLRIIISQRGFANWKYGYNLLILFSGSFFNLITPGGGAGGEPVRAYFLTKRYKTKLTDTIGIIAGDKVFHHIAQIILIAISVIAFILLLPLSKIATSLFIGLVFFTLIFASILLYLSFDKIKHNFKKLLKKFYFFKFIRNIYKSREDYHLSLKKNLSKISIVFKKVIFDRKSMGIKLLLSFGYWILVVLVSLFIFYSFGFKINFIFVLIVVFVGQIISEISPIPGGVGVTESAMFLLYSALGVNTELALLVALLERIIYYFYALIIGGISIIYLKLTN
jgi:glycosyltransferase 2 family protein